MLFSRALIRLIFLSSFIIFPFSPQAITADPKIVRTLDGVMDYVSPYETDLKHSPQKLDKNSSSQDQDKGRQVAVIWDFHGVVVEEESQPPAPQEKLTEEEARKPLLTLRKGSVETFEILKSKGIPFVIATAWNEFKPVLDEVIKLGLAELLDIDTSLISQKDWSVLEDFSLGQDKEGKPLQFKGHRIGRLVSLKYATHFEDKDYETKNRHYCQKIYALEAGCSEEEKRNLANLSHIFVVDDSELNLTIAEEDFPSSIHSKYETILHLLHFQPPKSEKNKNELQGEIIWEGGDHVSQEDYSSDDSDDDDRWEELIAQGGAYVGESPPPRRPS